MATPLWTELNLANEIEDDLAEIEARTTWKGGWVPAGEEWTPDVVNMVVVEGGAPTRYPVGALARLKQGGDWKYFWIGSVANAFLQLYPIGDYTLDSMAAITEPYISLSPNPLGWPEGLRYPAGGQPGLAGWHKFSGSLAYASATTMSGLAAVVASLQIGDALTCYNSGTKHFYVVGATGTTVTVWGGSSYSLASAPITDVYVSRLQRPKGFPLWFPYTPNWTATVSNPTLGNGTLTGRASISEGQWNAQIALTIGSTTNVGSGNWIFSPPANSSDNVKQRPGVAFITDLGTGNYLGVLSMPTASQMQVFCDTGASGAAFPIGAGPGAPHTWANGDSVLASIKFEV